MSDFALLPFTETDDLGWHERALCAQTDPEAFFPEKGGSTREAKRVCCCPDASDKPLRYVVGEPNFLLNYTGVIPLTSHIRLKIRLF